MANHLRWYINGTAGGKDGTEIDITQALNIGAVNTFALLTGDGTGSQSYYPPIMLPLYFRCESGYEISSGTLSVGNRDYTARNFIGALGTKYNYDQSALLMFKNSNDMNTALTASWLGITRITASGDAKNSLIITESNKITDVNSAIILIALIGDASKIGASFPQDLIEFSFTETAVTA